jgi:hypothetical protein
VAFPDAVFHDHFNVHRKVAQRNDRLVLPSPS